MNKNKKTADGQRCSLCGGENETDLPCPPRAIGPPLRVDGLHGTMFFRAEARENEIFSSYSVYLRLRSVGLTVLLAYSTIATPWSELLKYTSKITVSMFVYGRFVVPRDGTDFCPDFSPVARK